MQPTLLNPWNHRAPQALLGTMSTQRAWRSLILAARSVVPTAKSCNLKAEKEWESAGTEEQGTAWQAEGFAWTRIRYRAEQGIAKELPEVR